MSTHPRPFSPAPMKWRGLGCDEHCQRMRVLVIGEEHVRLVVLHDPEAHENYARSTLGFVMPLRYDNPLDPLGEVRQFGPLRVNTVTGDVSVSTMPISLTPTEWRILRFLACNPGRLVEREEISRAVWGIAYIDAEAMLRVHLSRLRGKLWEAAPLIQTVNGFGLRFRLELPA